MSGYYSCTHVTAACPVSATTYGYRPNIPANSVFLAVFALCTVAQIALGLWKRVPTFTFAISIATLGEALGYGGRLIMHGNPWSSAGFKIQIICLILSPSFLAGGIYLTLKHLVLVMGPEKSRLAPKLYTWIFISFDAFSIVLQASGGGIAAGHTLELIDIGNSVMIAGIVLQVITMFICILLALDFGRRLAWSKTSGSDQEKDGVYAQYAAKKGFRFYVVCTAIAFLAIFVRCIYRIPEMAGGWGNPLMQDEKEFLILDGAMIALASILLTVAHPGIFFPLIRSKKTHSATDDASESNSDKITA